MKQKKLLLAVLALVLILTASIGPAVAYFTDSVTATGAIPIHLANKTIIVEPEVTNWTKNLVIQNDEEASPVYVRAKAFCGAQYTLSIVGSDAWVPGSDGYVYYTKVLEPGTETDSLLVKVGNIPDPPEDGQEFSVEIVYESVLALFDSDGEGDMAESWRQGTDKVVIVEEGGNG